MRSRRLPLLLLLLLLLLLPLFRAAATGFSPARRDAFARRVVALLQVGAPTRGADEDAKARAQCDRYFNNYILKCTGGEGGPQH
jgi:hypothetical protein